MSATTRISTIGVCGAFALAVSGVAVSAESATPEEIVAKVQEAAGTLSEAGDAGLGQFNDKEGQWVWKDTYVFVYNCTDGIMAAHPISASLVGQEILAIQDKEGNEFFATMCDEAAKPNGGWVEYWWPKPGEEEGSRKITYTMSVPNTGYQVGAGVYDDAVGIAELEKLNN